MVRKFKSLPGQAKPAGAVLEGNCEQYLFRQVQ